jgi:hypothetical protein
VAGDRPISSSFSTFAPDLEKVLGGAFGEMANTREGIWNPAAAGVMWSMKFSCNGAAHEQNHAGEAANKRR